MHLAFPCLLAGVVLFGDFHGLLRVGEGERRDWMCPCLLILTESLISANWEGQFKQAPESGLSHGRDTGAERQLRPSAWWRTRRVCVSVGWGWWC